MSMILGKLEVWELRILKLQKKKFVKFGEFSKSAKLVKLASYFSLFTCEAVSCYLVYILISCFMKVVKIYTDGSCLGNPGPGGWAWLLIFDSDWKIIKRKVISGWEKLTTNNQMELTALIKSLEELKNSNYPVMIYTDSKYVLDGITKWIKKWEKNNWKTSNKQDVKNKDLWERLSQLMNQFQTEIHWVKAHSNDEFNNFVDKVARQKAKEVN